MPALQKIFLSGFVLAALCIFLGQSPVDSNPRNAAYWYQQAIEDLDSISDAQWNVITDFQTIGSAPTPELRSLLRSLEPSLALLRRGAAQEYSDFQLDFSEGFELLLPHPGQLRHAARLMNARAMLRMSDGDHVGAARELASMYRMGGHLSDDEILINSLVGAAIFSIADKSVQDAIDRGVIDSVAAAELARGVKQLDEDDPFGFIESIFGEHELLVSTLENNWQDADSDLSLLTDLVGLDGSKSEAILAQLQASSLDKEIAHIDNAMNDRVEIFMLDDENELRKRLQELEEAIVAGEYGTIASFLTPAFGKYYELMLINNKMVAERRAMLEQLAKGELDPNELLNAALVYRQAAEAYRAMTPEQRERCAAVAGKPTQDIDDDTVLALEAASSVIDLLRKGSQLRHCDFEPLRRAERPTIVPDYVIGMHELFILLQSDAIRLSQAGEADAAADRLAIGYRMVAHLGKDDVLISPLVAHDAFTQCTALTRGGLASGLFDTKRSQLQDAVQHIVRRDPFGYINAVMKSRKRLGKQLRGWARKGEKFDRAALEQLVGQWQGDELLYVVIVLETIDENNQRTRLEQQDSAEEFVSFVERLSPLKNIVSIDAIQQIQLGINELATQLETGNVDMISEQEIPSVGNWPQRLRRARADLRDVLRLLEKPEDKEAAAAVSSTSSELTP